MKNMEKLIKDVIAEVVAEVTLSILDDINKSITSSKNPDEYNIVEVTTSAVVREMHYHLSKKIAEPK